MRKTFMKRLSLALMGLVLAGSGSIVFAQAPPEYKYTYNADNGIGGQGWVQWWTANSGAGPVTTITWDGTHDAAKNPASGSLRIDSTWPEGNPVGENYYPIWAGWLLVQQWDTSTTANMDNYQRVEFDVFVDPSSTTLSAANGDFGDLRVMMNIGWGQPVVGTFVIPADATNKWYHVNFPIAKGMGGAWGPGFFRDGRADTSGAETIYIDNLDYVPALPEVVIIQQPQNEEVYAGQNITISVNVGGLAPFSYQWFKGTAAMTDGGNVSGSVGAALHINNVSAADIASYKVVITNSVNSITSSVVTLNVLAGPGDPFATATKLAGPVAFYELNESTDTSAGTATAFDHMGGFAGLYQSTVSNAFNGVVGPRPSDGFTNFLADNAAARFPGNNGKIALPALNLNSSSATFTAWIYPTGGSQPGAAPIVFSRSGNTPGSGFAYSFDGQNLGYNWNNDGGAWNWASGVIPPQDMWSFAVLVVTPIDATVYCFNTTTGYATPLTGVDVRGHGSQAFDGVTLIGQDQSDVARTFRGGIDDVAIYNRALSLGEVVGLYISATGDRVAPVIEKNPVSVTRFTGAPKAEFSVGAYGSATMHYQWKKVGGSLGGNASGENTPTLIISNATAANAGNYECEVSNLVGKATSVSASLTLLSPVGAYASAVLAKNPVAFYELNEPLDPMVGGVLAIDNWGGYNATYGAAVQNGFNTIAGPVPADGYAGFTAGNTAAAIAQLSSSLGENAISVPPLGMNTSSATITAWIKPTSVIQSGNAGLVFYRNGGGTATGIQYNGVITNSDGTTAASLLGYSWADLGGSWSWNSGLTTLGDTWSFVALVVTPTDAIVSVYGTNGIQRATNILSHPAVNFNGNTLIGVDNNNINRTFAGVVDDVAIFNRALTQAELDNLAAVGTSGVVEPVTLHLQGLQLSWSSGTLIQATNILGPWSTVTGASSPYTITPTGPAMFYRLGVPTPIMASPAP
jgi:hypothetical protein